MPQTTSKTTPMIFVAVAENAAVIKVVGRANFNSSVHFKSVINELRQRGLNAFVLDLTECVTMDSTFLGVLAGLVLQGSQEAHEGKRLVIQLLNPNQRVADLLDNLGVVHLFSLCSTLEQPTTFRPVEDSPEASKEELNKTCLEAHQLLMAINPANIPKFKEVTQFLAEDLKRAKDN
jgi:anti-sigma B factor antagonist